jgi:hypothetical protein
MAIDIEIVELLVNGKTLRIEVAANLYNMVGELEEVKTEFPLYTPISESVTSIVRALLPLDWPVLARKCLTRHHGMQCIYCLA